MAAEDEEPGGFQGLCRSAGKDLAFYLIPAIGVNLLILRLSKGALWMPHEWRLWVLGLGLTTGLACYRHALGYRDRHAPLPLPPTGSGSKTLLAAYEQDLREVKKRRSVAAWRRATAWFVLLVAAVGAQAVGLNHLVNQWSPSYTVVQNMFFSEPGLEIAKEDAPDLVYEGPCYLEWKLDDDGERMQMVGSFLFPVLFDGSAEMRRLVEETEATFGPRAQRNDRQYLMDYDPVSLKELITGEYKFWLGVTKFLFVLVHLVLIVSASTAYGLTFNVRDEICSWVGELF